MKRELIEKKLREANQRKRSAEGQIDYLTREIRFHDTQATEDRKLRQNERARLERAEKSIVRYSAMFEQVLK